MIINKISPRLYVLGALTIFVSFSWYFYDDIGYLIQPIFLGLTFSKYIMYAFLITWVFIITKKIFDYMKNQQTKKS